MSLLKTVEERIIPVEEIELSYRNPRQDFTKEDLKELAESLKKHGQIQPIVVRKKGDRFELVVGERRVRAAIYADIPRLRAEVIDLTDEEADARRLIENIHRKDLDIWEKVNGLEAFWERYLKSEHALEVSELRQGAQGGRSVSIDDKYEKLSKTVGFDPSTIKSWYHVALETEGSPRTTFVRQLPLRTLRIIARYPTDVQEKLAETIVEQGMKNKSDDAIAFVKLFEQNPDVELSVLADRAKSNVETAWVTLPKERAEEVKKESDAFMRSLEKKKGKALRRLQEMQERKIQERKQQQQLKEKAQDRVEHDAMLTAELTKDFVAKKEGLHTADEQYNQITSAYATGRLTHGEADLALELWKNNPKWDLETVVKETKMRFSEQEATKKPQPVYLLVEPELYVRIRAYADSKHLEFKEAIYSLLDYALDQVGAKGVGV